MSEIDYEPKRLGDLMRLEHLSIVKKCFDEKDLVETIKRLFDLVEALIKALAQWQAQIEKQVLEPIKTLETRISAIEETARSSTNEALRELVRKHLTCDIEKEERIEELERQIEGLQNTIANVVSETASLQQRVTDYQWNGQPMSITVVDEPASRSAGEEASDGE